MRILLPAAMILLLRLPAAGQGDVRKGSVTYLSGNVVYTSLGRSAGVSDSTKLYIVSGADTTATLVVFAVSSTSSACRVERQRTAPRIGDRVIALVQEGGAESKGAEQAPAQPPTPRPAAAATAGSTRAAAPAAGPPIVSVNGRVGVQYFTTRYSSAASKSVQPGVSLNLQGSVRDMPVKFELYGNVRGIAYGTQNPFSGALTDRTRIYRMFVGYDDGENRISVGRVIPTPAPSIGYIDGAVLSRTEGPFTLGFAGGFEPDFIQQVPTSDYRKFAAFGAYQTVEPFRIMTSVSYARTYYQTLLNREVVSGFATVSPTPGTFFTAQSDVDLRARVNENFAMKPKLTSLFASLNQRVTDIVTLSLGVNAWRPFYPLQSILLIPDSLLDRRLQASPSIGFSMFMSPGISFSSTYSPRTSDEGFGKEYTEYSTAGISNLLGQGVSVFGNLNWNATVLTRTVGYGANIQKTIMEPAVLTLRFQEYRYTLLPLETISVSQSIALDLMISLTRSLMVWGSVERLVGLGADGYTGLGEISWRF